MINRRIEAAIGLVTAAVKGLNAALPEPAHAVVRSAKDYRGGMPNNPHDPDYTVLELRRGTVLVVEDTGLAVYANMEHWRRMAAPLQRVIFIHEEPREEGQES